MAGLSPYALAAVWSVAMVVVTLAAAAVAARRVPADPQARVFLFLGIESVAIVFVAAAMLACFVFPEPFGIDPADVLPFVIVLFAYSVLSFGLALWLVVLPAVRAKQAGQEDTKSASSTTIRR